MPGFVLQLVSGLASPLIFLPGLAIGWVARRWWHLLLGAVVVGVVSEAEIMLIELPAATPDWKGEPMVFVAPLAWCGAGFLVRRWQRRISRLREHGAMRTWPVVVGMGLGALVVGALALGVGLLYLHAGILEFHTLSLGRAAGADYETVFFQYLFPGLLLGQLAGGLIGRVLARPAARASA